MISLGLSPDSPSALPLPHAIYVGLFLEDRAQPKGLAEAYFLDQAFLNFETCVYKTPSFVRLCPFEQMSWIRTIYVDPKHRRRRPYYLYLYLVMAYVFNNLGASHAGMATRADDPDFDRLYLKTGGMPQGHTTVPFFGDSKFALYAFDLKELLRHRRFRKISGQLHFDWEKMREIRSRSSLRI